MAPRGHQKPKKALIPLLMRIHAAMGQLRRCRAGFLFQVWHPANGFRSEVSKLRSQQDIFHTGLRRETG
jgi:hypothetical protein